MIGYPNHSSSILINLQLSHKTLSQMDCDLWLLFWKCCSKCIHTCAVSTIIHIHTL